MRKVARHPCQVGESGGMKVFELLEQIWEQLGKLLVYVQYCAGQDIQTAECRDFWLGSVYAAVGIGLLIAFVIG